MEVVAVVAERVLDMCCVSATNEISYICNCSKNLEVLRKETQNLLEMKGRVEQHIKSADFKGKELLTGVNRWVNESEILLVEATNIVNEEAVAEKKCCNLGNLYHYGKIAADKNLVIQQHQKRGKEFETCVSLPASTTRFIDRYTRKDLKNIDTQKNTLKKIIDALKDHQIVGIHGTGGVGKTTLASEAAMEMKNQFDHIEFTTISKSFDAKEIKEELRVATSKILNKCKVLIILDDVWDKLKLEDLDIPCLSDYMGCKVLITSRSSKVCDAISFQVTVDCLPTKEAWTLFERAVKSECKTTFKEVASENATFKEVASEIVEKCGGLPLIIQAVGSTLKNLKNRKIESWEAVLDKLKTPTDDDYKTKEITRLMLSYECLDDEVAKSLFLLCSMFPRTIALKRLMYYGLRLGIFNKPDINIQKAKYRFQRAVESLVSSSLLLPEKRGERLKMHTVFRDMAILIASEDSHEFLVDSGKGLTEWQPTVDVIKRYKKISLMENNIRELPDYVLDLPNLDTFLIQNNELSVVPNNFFQGMKKLKVLDMSSNDISCLPESLMQLKELRTLDLSGNKSLHDISILRMLTCLEILKLKGTGITKISEQISDLKRLRLLDLSENESLCEISIIWKLKYLEILKLRRTGIKNIPEEITHLTKLRLLDVYSCKDLSSFVPLDVLSKLICLEELYVELREGSYNFPVELSELKSFKILHLLVPELHISEGCHFENFIQFYIEGDILWQTRHWKGILQLSQTSFPFTMQLMKKVHVPEMLKLWDVNDLDNILPDLYREGPVEYLKYIEMQMCENVTSLVKTSDLDAIQTFVTFNELGQKKFFSKVEEIKLESLDSLEVLWDSPHQYISFNNLAKIHIVHCPSLSKLFPLSVAQELVNLNELTIKKCNSLEVIISSEDKMELGTVYPSVSQIARHRPPKPVIFPRLSQINLQRLPKLGSFYSGHSTIKYPSVMSLEVRYCDCINRWSYGENHIPNINFEHQSKLYKDINDYIAAQLEMKASVKILKGHRG